MKVKFAISILLAFCCIALAGCRAHGIDVTIQNNAQTPLRNVEVDYPGAAFGTALIAPGRSYWYHIKPLEDGELTITFEQDDGKMFKQKGPRVHTTDTGRLIIILEQNPAKQWHMRAGQT